MVISCGSGYGEKLSGSSKQSQEDRDALIQGFVREMGIESKVLIVAASMGGTYAWPFLAQVECIILLALYAFLERGRKREA